MIDNYIGRRFKQIRIELFEESQEFFCENINNYIIETYGKKRFKKLHFTQPVLSSFENDSKMLFVKYNLLLTYLYHKKNLNPAWLILENNQHQPKFLKQLEIDKTIVELIKNVENKYNQISDDLNAIRIIIDNSAFNK